MAGDDGMNNTTDKPFGITNIRTYVPITLDLDAMNYDAWQTLFQRFFISFGLQSHIDDPKPDTTTAEWVKLDSLLTLWLYGALSESLLNTVLKPEATARDVWTTLQDLFRDNKENRAYQLDLELRTIELGDMSIASYYQNIKSLSDQLANIGQPVPESNLVMYMVNGLGEKFSQVAGIIRHQRPTPSFSQVRSMLTLEETQLLKHPCTPQPIHRDHGSSSAALLAASDDNPRRSQSHDDRRRSQPQDRRWNDRRQQDRRRGSDRRQPDRRFNNNSSMYRNPPWGAWSPFVPPWAAWPTPWASGAQVQQRQPHAFGPQ